MLFLIGWKRLIDLACESNDNPLSAPFAKILFELGAIEEFDMSTMIAQGMSNRSIALCRTARLD